MEGQRLLSTEEAWKYLREISYQDFVNLNIAECNNIDIILIPFEDGVNSDEDNISSNNEEDTILSLGPKLLAQKPDIRLNYNENSAELNLTNTFIDISKNTGSSQNKKQKNRLWTECVTPDKQISGSNFNFSRIETSFEMSILEDDKTPTDIFKELFNVDIMEKICIETNRYATQKNRLEFNLSVEELYKFMGILLLSGYVKLPSKRRYWELKPDCYNLLVSNSMSRNRFDSILRFLHFNNNDELDFADKLYKIRPLIEHLNEKFLEFATPTSTCFTVDEAMEPYYGRHKMKQFIRGKPIRFGFKFYCLTSSDGYLLKFIPYAGKIEKYEGYHGTYIVKKLADEIVKEGSIIFCDNYFTSLPLLEEYAEKNINIIGTIRKDRLEKAPIKDLKNTSRGSHHFLQDKDNNITLARWNDNNIVTIATNINDNVVLNLSSCSRWNSKQEKRVSVSQPYIIKLYNAGMGGVDLFDQQRGAYRTTIRSKKWYWPHFRFMLNGSIVNLWLLYRRKDPKISLLEFQRLVVEGLLHDFNANHFSHMTVKGHHSKVSCEVRFDGINHFVNKNATQRRCAFCRTCTKYICIKCNVGLHPDNCFLNYHVQN